MTPLERRLRERIDTVTDERDEARARNRNAGKRTRRCNYCGARTNTSKLIAACSSHADLVEVDPVYAGAVA